MPLEVQTTEDNTRTLFSHEYGESFHSRFGACAESKHVFLAGVQVDRLVRDRKSIAVLEVGFGAGLNFLLTCAVAARFGAALRYVGLDKGIPSANTLKELEYGRTSGILQASDALIDWRSRWSGEVPVGVYEVAPMPGCALDLIIGDATQVSLQYNAFDAVFLDGFSPRRNPELWTQSFLSHLYRAVRPGGTLATFSAAGAVRRGLISAGFDVTIRPGPQGKRACLVARKPLR